MLNAISQEKILFGLNEEQKMAVIHGQGPQLIVAGAGTGKTSVITRRIAYLVAEKHCDAKQILALTFTDKAAEEMESRVDVMVPYGFTDSTICTFHAFGDRILREQGMWLGIKPDYSVLSAKEQIIFLRERLFELPLKKFRPLSDPTRHLEMLLSVLSRAKDEDITPEALKSFCGNKRSQIDGNASAEEIAILEKQCELASLYEAYQQLLTQEGLMDFGDLIVRALLLLRTHPDILAHYREKFRYILVDEFQDTNAAQFELIRLLAGAHANLTVVGDDDQSIYKFRGAAISNILQFKQYFPQAVIHVLNQNYRSTQSILDGAYRLIQHNNPERLEIKHGLNKRLKSQRDDGLPVLFRQFTTISDEADWIADEFIKRKNEQKRSWSDFALLVRSNRQADPYLRAFNLKGIPTRFSGSQGFYRRTEIRICTAFLRTIADPNNNLALYEFAQTEHYKLPQTDLSQYMIKCRRQHRSLFSLLQDYSLQDELTMVSDEGKLAIHRIVEDIVKFLEISRQLTTGQLLYRFLTESGILSRYTEAATQEADQAIQQIAQFFKVVQRYEQVAKNDRVIYFVDHLDMLEEIGDDPGYREMDLDAQAVQIMTVHRAKGLEFPIVAITQLVTNRFPSIDRSPGFQLPDELIKEALPAGDPHLAEERRLFYVAMTRAKDELIMTCSQDYGGSRKYKISRFVLEALEMPPTLNEKSIRRQPLEQIQRHAESISETLTSKNVGFVIKPDDPLSLSYYQIDDYLTCPLKYKYIHVLEIPVLPHHTIIYGKALHDAMNEYYRLLMSDQKISESAIIQVFLDSWMNQGFISREHEEMRKNAGIDSLKKFINNDVINSLKPKYIEKAFNYNLGANRIVGRIDRIDVLGNNQIRIVDFKSSEVADQSEADKKAKDSLQLKIYASAWLHIEGKIPETVSLYFFDSGIMGNAHPDADKILDTEEKIREVGLAIRQRIFTAKASVWVCNYCPFRTICPDAELG